MVKQRKINTSLNRENKGGETMTQKFSSEVPAYMRELLTIPFESPQRPKRKKRSYKCPSGDHKTNCTVTSYQTKTGLRVTQCIPCSVRRYSANGEVSVLFYDSLTLGASKRKLIRRVDHRL